MLDCVWNFIKSVNWGSVPDWLMLLTVILAYRALKNDKNRDDEVRKYKSSELFLTKSCGCLNEVLILANGEGNSRSKWVLIATLLENATKLSKKITEKTHQSIYNVKFIATNFVFYEIWKKRADGHPRNFIEINNLSKNKMVVCFRFVCNPFFENKKDFDDMTDGEKFEKLSFILCDSTKTPLSISEKETSYFHDLLNID